MGWVGAAVLNTILHIGLKETSALLLNLVAMGLIPHLPSGSCLDQSPSGCLGPAFCGHKVLRLGGDGRTPIHRSLSSREALCLDCHLFLWVNHGSLSQYPL